MSFLLSMVKRKLPPLEGGSRKIEAVEAACSEIDGYDIARVEGGSRKIEAVEAAYSEVDGYDIARVEKKRQRDAGIYVEGIQYGEIKPSSFARVLSWMEPKKGERFYDLGSGTGKAVLTAAALYPLGAATGIEIQSTLHSAALAARTRLSLKPAQYLKCGPFDSSSEALGPAQEHPWHYVAACSAPQFLDRPPGARQHVPPVSGSR